MPDHRFVTGTALTWAGEPYLIIRVLADQSRILEHRASGLRRAAALADLLAAFAAGELRFVTAEARPGGPRRAPADEVLALGDYPPRRVAVARARLAAIAPLLALPPGERTRQRVAERVAALRAATRPEDRGTWRGKASVSSCYRWIRAYEAAGRDLRALIPDSGACGGPGRARLPAPLVTLMDGAITDLRGQEERSSIDDLRHELAVRVAEENAARATDDQLRLPDRSTVARRVAALDVGYWFAGTRGARARERERPQVGRGERPAQPLDVVEIDETPADFVAVDDRDDLPLGRPYHLECRDVATKYPLGYNLAFERGYLAVMSCLHHAILPKTGVRERYGLQHDWLAHGIPRTLVTDNARVFIGQDLDDACAQLAIELVRTAPRQPRQKPTIERALGTLATMFYHKLPGTTFGNPEERGDYDSVARACIAVSEIDQALHRYYVDIDAERKHRGLGFIPARQWERAVAAGFPLRLPASADELLILLSRVALRVIEPYGIALHGLLYNDPDCGAPLAGLRARLGRQPVLVKWHPGDLGQIHVLDPAERRYLPVPAVDRDYARGLSVWKHTVIKRAARAVDDREDPVALGRAKRDLQRQFREARERARGKKRRATRWTDARFASAGAATRERACWPDVTGSAAAAPVPGGDAPVPGTGAAAPMAGEPDPEAGWAITYDLPQGGR